MLIIATVEASTKKFFSKCFAPIFPGDIYTVFVSEFCILNFISASIVSSSAVLLIGKTIPEVPSIEIPPITPSLSLKVFFATSIPFSTITVMFTVPVRLFSAKILLRLSIIICLGTGFMAGSPFGSTSPFFVNVPTPSPAKK